MSIRLFRRNAALPGRGCDDFPSAATFLGCGVNEAGWRRRRLHPATLPGYAPADNLSGRGRGLCRGVHGSPGAVHSAAVHSLTSDGVQETGSCGKRWLIRGWYWPGSGCWRRRPAGRMPSSMWTATSRTAPKRGPPRAIRATRRPEKDPVELAFALHKGVVLRPDQQSAFDKMKQELADQAQGRTGQGREGHGG